MRRAVLLFLFVAMQVAAQGAQGEELAKLEARRGVVRWVPVVEYERLVLTVSGAGRPIRLEFGMGEVPELELGSGSAEALPDGSYSYELSRVPKVDPEVRKKLKEARERGDDSIVEELRQAGKLPRGPMVQSGSFSVRRGAVVSAGDTEPVSKRPREGDLHVLGDLEVQGRKSFVASDPDDSGRQIYFAALEGPEVGTYYRGSARTEDGEAVVLLPAAFSKMTEERGLTVQLTSVGVWTRLYVVEKSPRRLVVRSETGTEGEFDFLIQGVRRGYADFQAERPGTD